MSVKLALILLQIFKFVYIFCVCIFLYVWAVHCIFFLCSVLQGYKLTDVLPDR